MYRNTIKLAGGKWLSIVSHQDFSKIRGAPPKSELKVWEVRLDG